MKRTTPIALSVLSISTLFLTIAGCASTSQHDDLHTTQASRTVESDVVRPWSQLSAEKKIADHIVFSPQPTQEEIRSFAAAGGNLVINSRTESEFRWVNYDEQSLVESLG